LLIRLLHKPNNAYLMRGSTRGQWAILATAMAGQPGFQVRATELEPHVLAEPDVRNLIGGSPPYSVSDPAFRDASSVLSMSSH
jgi:hypothetical protein